MEMFPFYAKSSLVYRLSTRAKIAVYRRQEFRVFNFLLFRENVKHFCAKKIAAKSGMNPDQTFCYSRASKIIGINVYELHKISKPTTF